MSYGLAVSDGVNVTLRAGAGYAGKDMSGGDDGGLHDYTLTAEGAAEITKTLSVGVLVGYTDGFDEDVLPEQDVDIFGAVKLSVTL